MFGRLRARLDASRAVLAGAASTIDRAPEDVHIARRTALSVRVTSEEAARLVLDGVGVALGSRSLCSDVDHARRVADLTVYLRQLDVVAASAELGRMSAERPG